MWRGEAVCTLSMQKTCQDGLCCWHCIWHPQRPLHADRSCQPFLMFMPDWSHQSHLLLWIFSLFAVLIQDRTCTWLNLANTQFLHPALRIQRFNEHINEPRTQSTEPQRNQERKERRLLKGHEEDIHFFSNFSACQDLSARPVWTQCSQDLDGTANRRTGEREFRSKTSWGTNLDRSGYLGGLFFFGSTPTTP